MGRMQAKGKGKGISGSALPYKRKAPKWLTLSSKSILDQIVNLAKKGFNQFLTFPSGLNASQIGVYLRDQQGIPQTRFLTGQKILRILKKRGCAPKIPEDLYALIKKAVQIRKHLEKNRGDVTSKFRLILVESRIHRLSRYYRRTQKLPSNWKYVSKTASALIGQ